MKTLRFNVFGRMVEICGELDAWQAFDLGADGKRRPADFIVPSDIHEHELGQYLADLFHEHASAFNDQVVQLPGRR